MPYHSENKPVYNPSLTEHPLDQTSAVIPKSNPSILEWLEDSGRLIEWTAEDQKESLVKPEEAEWDDLIVRDEDDDEGQDE